MRILSFLTIALIAIDPSSGHAGEEPSKKVRIPPPSQSEMQAVCRYVASQGPSIAPELISNGKLDANNDGQEENVTIRQDGGHSDVDFLEYRPVDAADNSPPIDYSSDAPDNAFMGAAWFRYGGRVYTIHFESEDLQRATYLGYINASNAEHVICNFESSKQESLVPAGAAPDFKLCRAVQQKQVNFLDEAAQRADRPNSEENKPVSFHKSRKLSPYAPKITIDFRNNGHPEEIERFYYYPSTRFDTTYYDQIQDGHQSDHGKSHDLLMKLQNLGTGNYDSGSALNSPRWFEFDGQVYFEQRSDDEHTVLHIADTVIEPKCTAKFEMKWSANPVTTAPLE